MSERALVLRSASELLQLLRSRDISSRELLQLYLDANERIGAQLNAVVTLDVEAATAAALVADERIASGDSIAAMLGLPMTIKDALATRGMRSTGGAVELEDHVPDADAEVVAKLRAAGAVIFGKTNLPRWSADVQAYNEIFGTTNNPWDPSCGPGGSSGGASAAVAAGLTAIDIGTDIGGSVRLPAHFAGVCGHKPSYGIVPQLGYISHPTYSTSEADVNVIGPIGRSVDDLELVFDVIAGPREDQTTAWTLNLPPARAEDSDQFRVAAHVDDPFVPVGAEVGDALRHGCRALEQDGVKISHDVWPEGLDFSDVVDVGLPLISAATSPGRSDDQFDEMRQIVLDPGDTPETLRMRAAATALFHRDWHELVHRRELNRHKWARFFEEYDVLLAPVAHVAAFEHQSEGTLYDRTLSVDGVDRPYTEVIMWTSQFGYVGLPSTVVPIAVTPRGLPVGIQIVGPYLGDRTTLSFARKVERLLGGYQVPPVAAGSG